MKPKTVRVKDKMQHGYTYQLVAPPGRAFAEGFKPELTPAEMLRLGVFGGKYMTDCRREFPKSWFAAARLSAKRRDLTLNFFGVDGSQPLSVWRTKGWLHPDDPVAGSNGTAAITWVVACRKRMRGGLGVGSGSNGTSRRSAGIVKNVTSPAASGNVRHSCIGPTTVERFEGAHSELVARGRIFVRCPCVPKLSIYLVGSEPLDFRIIGRDRVFQAQNGAER